MAALLAETPPAPPPALIVPGTEHWDGTRAMPYLFNDGGRSAAGYRGPARDCVARSIAIAANLPYAEVYVALAAGTGAQRASRGRRRAASARNGISTNRKWFKEYMRSLGFEWIPTMGVGTGCTVRLLEGELPRGRLVVSLSRHYTAVIDGVIHDTSDPTRATCHTIAGVQSLSHRCVYGYWIKNDLH